MQRTKVDIRKDLVRGSLIGGAAGDALGYAVEFNSYQDICARYGKSGIRSYELHNGLALISDDTQMSLFTANGILSEQTRFYMRGIRHSPEHSVKNAYKDWYYTQTLSFKSVMEQEREQRLFRFTWLSAIPELYACRAPGNTCLTAIKDLIERRTPQNHSKGCGGVMRIAPWPLFCACNCFGSFAEEEDIDIVGGKIAYLTHKHPLGWIPAVLLTHIIYRIVHQCKFEEIDKASFIMEFISIVKDSLQELPKLVPGESFFDETGDIKKPIGELFPKEVTQQIKLIERALCLAENNLSDIDNIKNLGEGWVGEEALTIAIYAVARHIDSFEDALVAAVNHDGDSDSTGAVAGNIMGAIVGYEHIPQKFKEHLELHDLILSMADDLHQGCIIDEYNTDETPAQRQWYDRYCKMKASSTQLNP